MRETANMRLSVLAIALLLLLIGPIRLLKGKPQGDTTPALIRILITVSDTHGKPIPDLKVEEFRVFEGKKSLRLGTLQGATEEQLTVGLMIDTSGSRSFQLPGAEREGAAHFLEDVAKMRANAFVGSFSNHVYLHADLTADLAELQAGLKLALMKPPQASSSLFAAIADASKKRLAKQGGRKILVITSDGVDNSSFKEDTEPKELVRKLLHDGTILYVIVFSDPNDKPSGAAHRKGIENMKLIAGQSGGQVFVVESAKEVTAAFESIATAIGSQYRLAFFPNGLPQRPEEFRQIRVETTRKDVVLAAPSGYFALVQ